MEGWDFPVDRTTLAVLDVFDLTVMANSDSKKGRPAPHNGRPFQIDRADVKKYGDAAGRTPEQIRRILNERMGHNLT